MQPAPELRDRPTIHIRRPNPGQRRILRPVIPGQHRMQISPRTAREQQIQLGTIPIHLRLHRKPENIVRTIPPAHRIPAMRINLARPD